MAGLVSDDSPNEVVFLSLPSPDSVYFLHGHQLEQDDFLPSERQRTPYASFVFGQEEHFHFRYGGCAPKPPSGGSAPHPPKKTKQEKVTQYFKKTKLTIQEQDEINKSAKRALAVLWGLCPTKEHYEAFLK